jgi:hypothetical protein
VLRTGFLNKHPFPVEAFFEKSLVLGFAVPKGELAALIPECLELDLFEDKWGFLAVAMVKTRGLRPKGVPAIWGRDFTLIGYRIFVRYGAQDGRRLRGLYILGSETNRRMMEVLGNLFTQYRYRTVEIGWPSGGDEGERISSSEGLRVVASRSEGDVSLPEGSPFSDWKEARRFAGPMPFTFSYCEKQREVVIVEGVREAWKPLPMEVIESEIPYISRLGINGVTLANAFLVEGVPYHWKKGCIEEWTRRRRPAGEC